MDRRTSRRVFPPAGHEKALAGMGVTGGRRVGLQPWLGPGWDPFGDLAEIQQEMTRLLESFLGQSSGASQPVERTWAPPMDVCETQADLRVRVELPGIPLTQIQLEIVEGALTIRGERHPDPAFRPDQLQRLERRYGPFFRRLNLPSIVDAEGARASYRDGILEIRLPKRPEATPGSSRWRRRDRPAGLFPPRVGDGEARLL